MIFFFNFYFNELLPCSITTQLLQKKRRKKKLKHLKYLKYNTEFKIIPNALSSKYLQIFLLLLLLTNNCRNNIAT